MSNEIIKVYYPDGFNNQQFAYCETRGSFLAFVENVNSFVGRLDMDPYAFEEGSTLQRYRMYWTDEDNDKVLINSDYSLRIFLNRTNGLKKVFIVDIVSKDAPVEVQKKQAQKNASAPTTSQPNPETSQARKAVHEGVECDNCMTIPIVGFRYKCVQCHDFDLCANCEQNEVHADHVMYRFPVPLPRHTELNRRFFKKMRHGCFGRPAETPESSERPRKFSRRNGHERHCGGTTTGGVAGGAFTNFYTMMCDLAEGMDQQDVEQAQTGGNNATQEKPATAQQASATSEAPRQSPNISNSSEEVPILPSIDPSYARAGVEVLNNFAQMFGKLLDPLGITVDVDIGLKNDEQQQSAKDAGKNDAGASSSEATAPPAENTNAAEATNASGTQTPVAAEATNASGTQTPVATVNLISPTPSLASIPESTKSNQSAPVDDGIRVFGNEVASGQQQQVDKQMEVDAENVEVPNAGTSAEANGANKKRGSSPIEASWTLVDKQFDELRLSSQEPEKQPEVTVEKQPESIASNAAATPATGDVNYSKLSQDLLAHMQAEQRTKQQNLRGPSSVVYHPDKKINDAVIAMMAMGFSNEGGWLISLLQNCQGDISKALDMLHPSR